MGGPVVYQTVDDIHGLIERGEIRLGGRLPAERDLADMLCVSRSTVRSALAIMLEANEIEVRRGRNGGAYVADTGRFWERYGRMSIATKSARLVDRQAGEAAGFSNVLAAQGVDYVTRVVHVAREVCSSEIGERFGYEGSKELFRIERVRYVGEEPISFEQTYIDPRRLPQFLNNDLTASIYDLLRDVCGVAIECVREQIEVTSACGKGARFLEVENGYPLLRVVMQAMDLEGETVVVSKDLYRPDLVRLTVENHLHDGYKPNPQQRSEEGSL